MKPNADGMDIPQFLRRKPTPESRALVQRIVYGTNQQKGQEAMRQKKTDELRIVDYDKPVIVVIDANGDISERKFKKYSDFSVWWKEQSGLNHLDTRDIDKASVLYVQSSEPPKVKPRHTNKSPNRVAAKRKSPPKPRHTNKSKRVLRKKKR
jgi:hypothetical protein